MAGVLTTLPVGKQGALALDTPSVRERSPFLRTTRWQGIATAIRLTLQARATACTADGLPIASAVRIAGRRPGRGHPQCCPHTLLEGAAVYIQRRMIRIAFRPLQMADHGSDDLLEISVVADEFRTRKAILEVGEQCFGIIA